MAPAEDPRITKLEGLYRRAKSGRTKLEPVWFMNLAYYEGQQWMAWDGRQLYRPKLKPNRITVVDNRITPAVRTEVAKLTKNRPVFTISPRTADEEDSNASSLGEQLMLYLWEHLSMQEQSVKALLWSRICGAGFLKVFWDPTMGDGTDAIVGPNGKVLEDSSGKPVKPGTVDPYQLSQSMGMPPGSVKKQRISQGDIRIEVRSPFQMYIDPLCDSFPDAEWLIEESIKSQESVYRQYGVMLEPDQEANPGMIQARLGAGLAGSSTYKGIRVKEYWCKPCQSYPQGCRTVWAKNQILAEDGKPFDPMPYVMLSGIPAPGRLFPMSIVEHLRGPQTELNKVKSQIQENMNRVGNPTILASKQSVQDKDKFVSSMTMPGGVYFFDDLGSPNTVPTFLQAPPLPEYVINQITLIEDSIQQISGQHEVTTGNVPPGVTAASAINLLLEQDDTQLGPAVTDYEVQLGRFGQKILKLAAHYYTDARTIRIAGDNGAWQIFDFRGSMLRDNTHVQVQAGSAFPQSKAAKQAAMQDLLNFFVQSGNAPHGRQLAQFLQDWEVGGAERLIEEYTLDEQQAERENARMCSVPQLVQTGLPINDYDNDQAHIDAHQDHQKSQRYEQYPQPVKMLFESHVAEHKERLASQQQAQMQLEQGPQAGVSPDVQDAGAQQQQAIQGAQAAQQLQGGQQQQEAQGNQQFQQMTMAHEQAAQSQRHAEEAHQQQLRHKEEQHQAALSQRSQGGPSGR